MRKLSLIWGVLLFLPVVVPAAPITLTEGFDSLPDALAAGWDIENNSDPLGTTDWFQGNPDVFAAQGGANDSYAAANYLNTDPLGGDISTWLLSPELTVSGDTVLSFFTRAVDPIGEPLFPDRLQVLFSANGGINTVLLTINPNLETGGYPTEWTFYEVSLSGLLGGPVDGRFAFHYFVENTTINGDYIGIDTVSVTAATPVPEPGTAVVGVGLLGLGLLARARRRS